MSSSHPRRTGVRTIGNGHSVFGIIDPATVSVIAEFAREKGYDIVQNCFRNYLKFSCAAMAQLQEKVDSTDYGAVELLAHSLRAASLQVGAHRLVAVLEKIELGGQSRRLDQLNAAVMSQLTCRHVEVNEVLATIIADPEKWLEQARRNSCSLAQR